jgi:hypothetical protein
VCGGGDGVGVMLPGLRTGGGGRLVVERPVVLTR